MTKKITARAWITGMIAIAAFTTLAFGTARQASAATAESLSLVSFGKTYIGTPYVYGSTSGSTDSFDCSSYVQHVFGELGISLPRTSSSQAYSGDKVDKAYLSVGDLLFFRTGGAGISHVGIYAGNGKMLHASSSKGVTLSDMTTGYWKNAYVTARRVL